MLDVPGLLQVQNLLRRITLVIPQQELEGLSSFKTLICLSSVKSYCLIRTWHEFYPPFTPLEGFSVGFPVSWFTTSLIVIWSVCLVFSLSFCLPGYLSLGLSMREPLSLFRVN